MNVMRSRFAPSPTGLFLRIGLAVVILLAVAVGVRSQTAITISGLSSLNFGPLPRSGSSSIDYASGSAAQFRVTGDTASNVRITISFSGLAAQQGLSSSAVDRSIEPSVGNSDCAYSLDDGATWNVFSSGSIFQDTQFPSGPSPTSTIMVRVGGNLLAGLRQQRGSYSGTLTLTAEYR